MCGKYNYRNSKNGVYCLCMHEVDYQPEYGLPGDLIDIGLLTNGEKELGVV
jgi:hypothetical protein